MAVSLGYKNVYRDPYGFPEWQEQGLPIADSPTEPITSGVHSSGQASDRSLQGWAMRGPGVEWRLYSEQTLNQAVVQKKPVIIDFYADWCTPCRELEEATFHRADVVRKAQKDFIMIKVDVTQAGDPLQEQLLKQYGVKGVPTIVFLDAQAV